MDLEEIRRATGSDYCYDYEELPCQATLEQLNCYCHTTKNLFARITKSFSADENSRWVLRHYLAIKFIAASSLLAGSSLYARDHNLLMGVPYFNYYAVLNACRAYLLTSPHVVWDGVKTMTMTHENLLNRTADYMRALDPGRRILWRERLALFRQHRELYSYRFPLSGPDFVGRQALAPEEAITMARLIAELASINSECLQASLARHAVPDLPVLPIPDHAWASAYALAGESTHDPSDRYRFGKLVSWWGTVSSLQVMTFDGLADDLYGSWASKIDEGDEQFDPDEYSRLILSL